MMAKARVNLEVELWTDARFQKLMIELGDRLRATGAVVHLWILAQQYWCPNRKPIPQAVWEASEIPEAVIRCGLAERRENGIYAKGTEDRFEWWFKGIEQRRAAGKQRAIEGQRDSSGRWQIGSSPTTKDPAGTSGIQPSPSSSPSKRKKSVGSSPTTQLWDYYSKELAKKGVAAIHQGAKTNKLAKTLLDRHGDAAQGLVDAFVSDQDGFVRDQAWSFGLLVSQDQKYAARAIKRVTKKGPLTFGEEDDHVADVRPS